MSIEKKLQELEALAEELQKIEEGKKDDESDKPEDTSDEPEGSDGEIEIETDDLEGKGDDEDDKEEKKDCTEAELSEAAIKDLDMSNQDHRIKMKAHLDANNKRAFDAGHAHDDSGLTRYSNAAAKAADKLGIKYTRTGYGLKLEETTEKHAVSIEAIFEGQEFSDEFKAKVKEIFEAAVQTELDTYRAELKESLLEESVQETLLAEEQLAEKVDGYLDYIVEQWVEKNSLALDRGIKTEILESFVDGLKGLFESHYIDAPDEKYDLVEAVQTEKQELTAEMDNLVEEITVLRKELRESKRAAAVMEAVADMVATDAEKFKALVEDVSFVSEEEFKAKLEQIRESFFAGQSDVKEQVEEIMTDTPVEVVNESTQEVKMDPAMAAYLATFARR